MTRTLAAALVAITVALPLAFCEPTTTTSAAAPTSQTQPTQPTPSADVTPVPAKAFIAVDSDKIDSIIASAKSTIREMSGLSESKPAPADYQTLAMAAYAAGTTNVGELQRIAYSLEQQQPTSLMGRALAALAWDMLIPGPETARETHLQMVKALIDKLNADSLAAEPNGVYAAMWASIALASRSVECPRATWAILRQYLVRQQREDGGWGSADKESDMPTTAAAVAALARICSEHNEDSADAVKALDRGRQWLDKHYAKFLEGAHRGKESAVACWFYLEQASIATGQWQLTGRNIFADGSAELVKSWQQDNKAGAAQIVTAAQTLMFMRLGTRPVGLLQLQYDGKWDIRRRGVQRFLAPYLSRRMCCETFFQYQTVHIDTPLDQWPPSKVLMITGSSWPKFSPEQTRKLRQFILLGGAVIMVPQGPMDEFRKGAEDLTRDFKTAWRTDIASDSAENPKSKGLVAAELTNGMRPLVLLCYDDLTPDWQDGKRESLVRGTNIIIYAIGRGISLGIDWPEPAALAKDVPVVKLARVSHAGNWDPEPFAYERFARVLAKKQGVKLDVLAPVAPAGLARSGAKLAVIAGPDATEFNAAERKALDAFVRDGGTLVFDAAGSKEFFDATRKMLAESYGLDAIHGLAADSPLLTAPKLTRERLRLSHDFAPSGDYQAESGLIHAVRVGGRDAILVSQPDIGSGLLGRYYGAGYRFFPESAYDLLRNIVLHSAGLAEKPAATEPNVQTSRP